MVKVTREAYQKFVSTPPLEKKFFYGGIEGYDKILQICVCHCVLLFVCDLIFICVCLLDCAEKKGYINFQP